MTATMFLIGEAIQHSLSPPTWNRVFSELGLDTHYGLRDVDAAGLPAVADELRSGRVIAANVTMPHKAWAAAEADVVTAEVQSTGVANFLQLQGDQLFAANTDVVGARRILAATESVRHALMLGAGGTARALLAALAGNATTITLANRTRARATALAETWRTRFEEIGVIDWDARSEAAGRADLVLNTTPIGRSGDRTPLPQDALHPPTRLYDVIYSAEPTLLQRQAVAQRIPMVDGLTHLAAQAVAMLELLDLPASAASLIESSLADAAGRGIPWWP